MSNPAEAATRENGELADILRCARAIIAQGNNVTYPSRASAQQVRRTISDLVAALAAKGK